MFLQFAVRKKTVQRAALAPRQEQAAERLRDTDHDRESARLVAEEAWALNGTVPATV